MIARTFDAPPTGAPGRRWAAPAAWAAFVAAAVTAFYLWSYRDTLHGFFAFDDYWMLFAAARIRLRSPLDVLQFLVPVPDFRLYRPISTVLYFYLLRHAWGYDVTAYHVTHFAFHVVNGVVVYALGSRLLRSRPAGAATAIAYACAPGHAFAISWLAAFFVTGTALFYLLALWTWIAAPARARLPVVLALFCIAVLSSELAVTLPVVLTLHAVLIENRRDWRSIAREQAPLYVVAAAYTFIRLYYLLVIFPTRVTPMELAYYRSTYGMVANPISIVRMVGRYLGQAVNVVYTVPATVHGPFGLGLVFTACAAGATVLVLTGRWTAPSLRVAAFGMDVFIVAIGPVLLLPKHVNSYYVGIAGLGVAVAMIALSVGPRGGFRLGPWIVVTTLLVVHVVSTRPRLQAGDELSFVRNVGDNSASWIYTVSVAARGDPDEVVLPINPTTGSLFGDVHRVLLCARYEVRLVRNVDLVESAPGRVIVREPLPLPDGMRGNWGALIRPCPTAS